MTFQQMYDATMVLFDKAGSPYIPQYQFDIFANIKMNAWIDFESDMLERDEKWISDLMYVFKVVSKTNTNQIDRVVDTPNFRKILRFNMTYANPCDSKSPDLMSRIYPSTLSEIDDALNNSFNKPSDEEPQAIATQLSNGNSGWQVFSTTIPKTLNMTYVRNPQMIDSANNPNTVFEGDDYVAYILMQLIAYKMDLTIENFNRMKAGMQDIQPQLQQS